MMGKNEINLHIFTGCSGPPSPDGETRWCLENLDLWRGEIRLNLQCLYFYLILLTWTNCQKRALGQSYDVLCKVVHGDIICQQCLIMYILCFSTWEICALCEIENWELNWIACLVPGRGTQSVQGFYVWHSDIMCDILTSYMTSCDIMCDIIWHHLWHYIWNYVTLCVLVQYLEEVRTVGKAFIQLGLRPGHGVGIIGFNSPEWFFAGA